MLSSLLSHPRHSDAKPAARGRSRGLVVAGGVALVALAATGCSRSLGEFSRAEAPGPPVIVAPVVTATGSVPADVPATALAPEEGGLATYDPTTAQLPAGTETTADGKPKKLTDAEKARIIAELEALARRQSEY